MRNAQLKFYKAKATPALPCKTDSMPISKYRRHHHHHQWLHYPYKDIDRLTPEVSYLIKTVGLLWTHYQPIAKPPPTQENTTQKQKKNIHASRRSRTHDPSNQAAKTYVTHRAATGTDHQCIYIYTKSQQKRKYFTQSKLLCKTTIPFHRNIEIFNQHYKTSFTTNAQKMPTILTY
jgi:hypothetical protein